jgi:hypothetical protein
MKKIGGVLLMAAVGLLVAPAAAEFQLVNFFDTSHQDVIPTGPLWVDELGLKPPFPDAEWITSSYVTTTYRPCLENPDDPGIPNMEVTITNHTNRYFNDGLYYVADPETTLTNDDGLVNGQLAFKIDMFFANTPLIYQSYGMSNNCFEPGETWRFVIQDYSNTLGLPPHLFGSIGVGSASGGDIDSSGSIITPEPAALSVLLLAVGTMLRRR